jgi:succinate-acetate transporter protein
MTAFCERTELQVAHGSSLTFRPRVSMISNNKSVSQRGVGNKAATKYDGKAFFVQDGRNSPMPNEDKPALEIRDNTANPAPLGLLAFGMTTVLLNCANAGLYELSSMVLAMGIFYGGLAQVIAGALEWKKNNTFGLTAFLSYGMFWLSLVALVIMPGIFPKITGPNATAMAVYLGLWGLFTLVMFIGTLKISRALQVVFGTLTLLFALLAAAEATGNASIHLFAGYEGIFCGLSAMYTGLAQVLNELYGNAILPLGPVKR